MKAFSKLNDLQTWQLFKAGDKRALSHIYHTYYNDLFDYGCKINPDERLVEDCIQDFFLYLWQKRENLGEVNHIRYYLVRSFRRRLLQYLRKQRNSLKQNAQLGDLQPNMEFSFETKLVEQEHISERNRTLLRMLNQLTPKQKEVVYLKYFEDLSYKEIAELMDLNYQTVVNHFYEAFKKIRKNKHMILAGALSALFASSIVWLV